MKDETLGFKNKGTDNMGIVLFLDLLIFRKIKWGCSASSFDLYGLPSPKVLGWGVSLFHDVKYWNNTAESTFVAIRIQI